MPAQKNHLPVCIDLLSLLHALLDHARQALAQRCIEDGKLNSRRFDEMQVPSYELAWAYADLLAAQNLMRAMAARPQSVEAALASVFAIEAIQTVLSRIETLHLEMDLDVAPVQAFATSPLWTTLRREAGNAAAQQRAGLALAAAEGHLNHPDLSESHIMARDTFRRFAQERVAPWANALHRENLTVPEALLQPLREMGVFGLSIPERFGGSAPDDHEDSLQMILVTEALSEASLAGAGSLITRPEILSRALLMGGTQAQKAHWLPRLAAGDPLCAIAITEPDFGSDVASLKLKGSRVPGGWRLNGAKTWCTFAGKAGVLMVVVRTGGEGHRGLSLILVEKPSTDGHEFQYVQNEPSGGGRLTGRAIPTIGYRGMHSFDLSFEDVFVPDSHVIGEEAGLGKGFYYTMAGMTAGRLQTAGRAAGVMQAAVRAAVRYVTDRKVFGAPLLDTPLTQAKLARMGARLLACQHFAYAVANKSGTGGGRMEASLVKLLACRSAEWVTREALQLHGGMGYAEETAVSRLFVDSRVLSIFEGAEETLALKVIARNLLDPELAEANPSICPSSPLVAAAA